MVNSQRGDLWGSVTYLGDFGVSFLVPHEVDGTYEISLVSQSVTFLRIGSNDFFDIVP